VIGTVLREIQLRLLEDGDLVGKALHLGRPFAEFVREIKVCPVQMLKPEPPARDCRECSDS
jgi:hypothetical protein